MNNLCKFNFSAIVLVFFSCTDHKEPMFEFGYTYKNGLSTEVTIEFYGKNREKRAFTVIDSLVMPSRDGYYTFGPEYNDSVTMVFSDNKKVTFKAMDKSSPHWSLNATNSYAYKEYTSIKGNLTTYVYTYTIDNKIYELAK